MSQTLLDGTTAAPPEPKHDGPKFRAQWRDGDTEWAIDSDGHYRILRCGDLVPGVRVKLRLFGLTHRRGTVQALVPGWGVPLPVVVVVELDPPTRSRPDPKDKPPVALVRQFRPDELQVIA
jgi:hypothetical protein